MKNTHNLATEQNFKDQLRKIDPNMGLSQTADEQTDDTCAGHVETKFGKFQVGSFLSYQVVLRYQPGFKTRIFEIFDFETC